jgi:hypothetical protein
LILALLELALRLFGNNPLPVQGEYLNQIYEPKDYSRPDSLCGYALNSGRFHVTYNDSLKWTATHLADGSRSTGWQGSSSDTVIALYGCSNIYGIGLDDSLSIGWKLQQRLTNRKVVNFGIGGGSLVRSMLMLERHLKEGVNLGTVLVSYASYYHERNVMARSWRKTLYPNVQREDLVSQVLIPYAVTDGVDIEVRYCSVRHVPMPMVNYSAVMNSLDMAWVNIDLQMRKPSAVAAQLLQRISRTCQMNKIRLIIVVLTDDSDTRSVLGKLDDEEVEFIYLRLPNDNSQYDLMPYDPHPNAAATAIFTEQILTLLTDHKSP